MSCAIVRAVFSAAVAVSLSLVAGPSSACSAFLLERGRERVFAKSYDWHTDLGHVTINPRGAIREALVLAGQGAPARWTAKYASVTFNQYGRELPNSGMNEAGLAVEILWLDKTRHEPVDARPAINALQWVQHMLDQYPTTAEVVVAARGLRVFPMAGALTHYLVCDKGGDCAVVEHLKGRLQVTTGATLRAKAITNDTCSASQVVLDELDGFGGKGVARTGGGSLARYSRVAFATRHVPERGGLVDHAFATLDSVRGTRTQWQIAYDLQQLRVSWRSTRSPTVKSLDLGKVAGACPSPPLTVDVQTEQGGDVTGRLKPWSADANRSLVGKTFQRLGGQAALLVPTVVALPEKVGCEAHL